MNWLLNFVPFAIAALIWWGLAFISRRMNMMRIGELIFWDAIILVIVYLIWLRWF